MKTKELGTTGIQIPEVGLGTYLYHGTAELLRQGIERGAKLIDTAEHYKNEELVGKAIAGMRDSVFVATKVTHWRRKEVLESADASLRRLDIDTIDLYQIHWPNSAIPIEETISAMEELVDQGKVRFIGVSNFTLPELKRAQRALRKYPISSNQVRYSIIHRTIEPHLLPYCEANGITVIAFSSLGHSFPALLAADRRGALAQVSAESGKTIAQVALNWCLARPNVVTIPKTESLKHLVENCESSGWRLSALQMAFLNQNVSYRSRGLLELAARRLIRGMLQRLNERKINKTR
jgi:diketogulonate reductase-like aldo/keto reductase